MAIAVPDRVSNPALPNRRQWFMSKQSAVACRNQTDSTIFARVDDVFGRAVGPCCRAHKGPHEFWKAFVSFAEISKLARFAGKACPLERQQAEMATAGRKFPWIWV
jgi:hypothetical protein